MHNLRFGFLGATAFSEALLLHLLEKNLSPQVVFTIPQDFSISYAHDKKVHNYHYADLHTLCCAKNIPVHSVEGKEASLLAYHDILMDLNLDVLLVMGWYYRIPTRIRLCAKWGAWGIHASMLPQYAGGAPLVWAMINGETQTGITLFRLDEGVDDGDIISQAPIIIEEHDTIKEVYAKATETAKVLLTNALSSLPAVSFTSQDKQAIRVYPQRTPKDGELDLSLPSNALYNFIRAQSSPYPGAFIRTVDGKKLVIEKARIESDEL